MDEGTRKQLKEQKEKKRMRGKNKSMKRYLRKHRKNVIDPATVCSTPFPRFCFSLFHIEMTDSLYSSLSKRNWKK